MENRLADVYSNLAIDEALLQAADEAEDRRVVLRLWEQPSFAVVLGASCRLNIDVNVDLCRIDDVPIARRSSGGGTVVIGAGAFNFAIVLPIDFAPELKAVDSAQTFVLGRTAASLRAFVPAIEVRGSGDLAIGNRKCSGSAQRRLRRSLLIHATILYDFPIDLISRYLNPPQKRPTWRTDRSHEDFLINIPLARARIAEAIRAAWLPNDRPILVAPIPDALVAGLRSDKLADRTWIERF